MSQERQLLDRDDILLGLQHLDRLARADGITIDLSIYGGAALAIAFDMRPATRDVDAVIRTSATNAKVREYVAQIAEAEGWPVDWLNDGVKGFVSGKEKMAPLTIPGVPVDQEGGLRIQLPTPEYLFAMKCMAMRSGVDGPHDHADIIGLARTLGIKSPDQAFEIISSFYPKNIVPLKVQFGVEELMERVRMNRRTRLTKQATYRSSDFVNDRVKRERWQTRLPRKNEVASVSWSPRPSARKGPMMPRSSCPTTGRGPLETGCCRFGM